MATFGKDIIEGWQEFADALDGGEPISDSEKLTCHKMVLNLEPTPCDPVLVRTTRKALKVSPSVFARFLGVSRGTVQAWEQGENPVTGAPGRLMDEIRINPKYFRGRLRSMAERKVGEVVLQ